MIGFQEADHVRLREHIEIGPQGRMAHTQGGPQLRAIACGRRVPGQSGGTRQRCYNPAQHEGGRYAEDLYRYYQAIRTVVDGLDC
jgi:hypothetical protein